MTILTGAKDTPTESIVDGVRVVSIDLFGLMRRTWKGSRLTFARQLLFPLVVLLRMYLPFSDTSDIGLRDRLSAFDVCHGHIYSSGLLAYILARSCGAVAVNTIHGSYYPIWDRLTNPFAAMFYRTAERILAPLLAGICDLQLHTGEYFAEQVLAWGAAEDRVMTIHNGADLDMFDPSVPPLACREGADRPDGPDTCGAAVECGLTDTSLPVILTARRLVKKNGINHLIRAAARVLEKERCQLLIIGDGEERPALEELADRLGIREHVHFTGMIPHSELPPWLALADIAVVPSLIEASSIFMLEAMAMAKPVIASNTGGLPEVIGPSTGILVGPADETALADAIVKLLHNRQLRLRLGLSARNLMEEEYSWRAVAARTVQEYARLRDARKG
ncbi:MAG: glycosyltransferase family 4 protein [Methanosarcinaceae archaeon]|nr:glycosyltransferase family 4 protein [Methanosarcinaceae archaeon]